MPKLPEKTILQVTKDDGLERRRLDLENVLK